MLQNKYYTLPKNCDFATLANGKTDNDCTPKLLDSFSKFRGIAINGPDTILWPKGGSAENNVGPFGTTMAETLRTTGVIHCLAMIQIKRFMVL